MPTLSDKLLRLGSVAAVVLLAAACTDMTAPEIQVEPAFEIIPGEVCDGRMTGGGQNLTIDGVKVSKGLTLHCDITLSNNLNITWDGGHWHIQKESLWSVVCIDDPAYDPTPPDAPFDTFIAWASGRLGNQDGSIIWFKFIDDGEPGTTDEAYIRIWAPGADPMVDEPILDVGGVIDNGNLQAHFDQPHNNGRGRG